MRRPPPKNPGGYRGFWSEKITDAEYLEKIRAKCERNPNGCLEWRGQLSTKGYGQMSYRGKVRMLHRLVYALTVGPIPPGKLVCHTCDNRRCCETTHLWIGTPAENSLDMVKKGRCFKWTITHCPRGHPYDEANTIHRVAVSGRPARGCKACTVAWHKSAYYLEWRRKYQRERRARARASA